MSGVILALQKMEEVLGSQYEVVSFDARWMAEHGRVFTCATCTIYN
jgi:hypothetical protein